MRPTRVAPLALFLREDADWLLASPQPQPAEVAVPSGARSACRASDARRVFLPRTRAQHRPPCQRSGRRAVGAGGRGPGHGGWLRESARADRSHKTARRGPAAGPRVPVTGRAAGRCLRHGESEPPEYVERFARQLLQRWGIVFRDIAARETLAPPWRDILVVLRRMETRGEIRGGRFAAAFVGEQFALPEALDLLRAVRRTGEVDVAWDALPPWLAGERAAVARIA